MNNPGADKLVIWTMFEHRFVTMQAIVCMMLLVGFFLDSAKDETGFPVMPVIVTVLFLPFLTGRKILDFQKKSLVFTACSRPYNLFCSDEIPFTSIHSFNLTRNKKGLFTLTAVTTGGTEEIATYISVDKLDRHLNLIRTGTGLPVYKMEGFDI